MQFFTNIIHVSLRKGQMCTHTLQSVYAHRMKKLNKHLINLSGFLYFCCNFVIKTICNSEYLFILMHFGTGVKETPKGPGTVTGLRPWIRD